MVRLINMHKNSIQSSVHPDEYTKTLKTGLPWGILGIGIGLIGQMWLKPDPFSLIGFLAFSATIGCLIIGFRRYIKLKLSDRFPTIIEWDKKNLYILESRSAERRVPIKNILTCNYQDRTIALTLTDNKQVILKHFSERAAKMLQGSLYS